MRASQVDRQGRMTNVSDAVHLRPAGDASPRPAKPTPSQPAGVSQPTRKPDGPMKRLGQALVWVVVVLALGGGGYYAWLKRPHRGDRDRRRRQNPRADRRDTRG